MDVLNFSANEYRIFILILIRVSIILFLFPFYGSPVIPVMVKTSIAFLVSVILFPVVAVDPDLFPIHTISFVILVFSELFIGLALSFSIHVFFGTVQFAGQIIGFQMGFSMINVVDPQSGVSISVLSQIGYLAALLIFILVGGHHIILSALVESFRVLNMGSFFFRPGMMSQLNTMVSGLFVLGIKLAAPGMAALLFTSAAFGICAKFVPQMPVLIVAFPLKIAIGLMMFGTTLQITMIMTRNYIGTFRSALSSVLIWLGGG